MDEKDAVAVLNFLGCLETVDDVIINIADKYTVDHSEESYMINKRMLTEFAQRMGLINNKDG